MKFKDVVGQISESFISEKYPDHIHECDEYLKIWSSLEETELSSDRHYFGSLEAFEILSGLVISTVSGILTTVLISIYRKKRRKEDSVDWEEIKDKYVKREKHIEKYLLKIEKKTNKAELIHEIQVYTKTYIEHNSER